MTTGNGAAGTAQIQTVRGLLPAASVKVADAHSHLWIHPAVPGGPALGDEGAARRELHDFETCGGSLVVDCQPGGCGRNGEVLLRLAQSSGVGIVAATGFHLSRYYPPGSNPWHMSDEAAVAWFTQELTEGLREAPAVKAGVVKTAWTGRGGREEALMRAALEAARVADAAVVVHTEAGSRVEDFVRLAVAYGAQPSRIQLSHVDKRPDLPLHKELAGAGFILGYDTFLRPKYRPEEHVWPLLYAMLAGGFGASITLGLDLVDLSAWRVAGGPGLRTLPQTIVTRLAGQDVGDDVVRALAGRTAARLLSGANHA